MLAAIIFMAVGILIFSTLASAERRGEDSSPPVAGNWIIDSPGNYIGNETYMGNRFEDRSVEVNGNITITNGGELKLFNTSINMKDFDFNHVIIEGGGKLVMLNNSVLSNNIDADIEAHENYSYIGFIEMDGSLIMRNYSSISRTIDIYSNSSAASMSLQDSNIGYLGSFFIKDHNITFANVTVSGYNKTALFLVNTSLTWLGGRIDSAPESEDDPVIFMEDSSLYADRLMIRSGSNHGRCMSIKGSTFIATNHSQIGSNRQPMAFYAMDSHVVLSEMKMLSSSADTLLECYDSSLEIHDTSVGFYDYSKHIFDGTIRVRDCTVLFRNSDFYRFEGNAITGDRIDLTIENCNFWNVTGDVFDLEDSTLYVDEIGIYNNDGDAFHLESVNGSINNLTIDEEDPFWIDGFPFPPVLAGYGQGTLGHAVFALDSHLSIIDCMFAATQKDVIHLRDSTVEIRDCMFRNPGIENTSMVHGIYMVNSFGSMEGNRFHKPYLAGGYDLYALDCVPLNLTDFIEQNTFSDERIFQQVFTLYVRVMNETGSPVNDVDLELTNGMKDDLRHSNTGIDGWARISFPVPAYEIYRHAGVDNETNESYEYFTNVSYNNFHIFANKEYRSYNYSVTCEEEFEITGPMNHIVYLNVSTPELNILSGGAFPMVLEGGELEMTGVIRNFGERTLPQVNLSYYYSSVARGEWIWFGSDTLIVPGIYQGGNSTEFLTAKKINAPGGSYHLKFMIDPNDELLERNEANNEFILMDAFEIFTRPMAFIDDPLAGTVVNGSIIIAGHGEDDYGNGFHSVEFRIDGVTVTIPDGWDQTTGSWTYPWDTKEYDPGVGGDRYPNGPHIISVRVRNSNPSEFDTSEWTNITVTVVNVPTLEFINPQEGEVISIEGDIPLYESRVRVLEAHDLSIVRMQIDNGSFGTMTQVNGDTYRYLFDTSKFEDGYHTITYEGKYGFGTVTESVTIFLNSPDETTKPGIDVWYVLNNDGLTIGGNATDDHSIDWVQIQLDNGSWISVGNSNGQFVPFQHFWNRGDLVPDSHSITVRASDGYDVSETIFWVQIGLIYDLDIVDLQVPQNCTEDQWVNFSVKVINIGPYASPEVDLILHIGEIMRTVNGISIPADSEMTIPISWRCRSGNHTVTAIINPTQSYNELDPNNNDFDAGIISVQETWVADEKEDDDFSGIIIMTGVFIIVLGAVAFLGHMFLVRKQSKDKTHSQPDSEDLPFRGVIHVNGLSETPSPIEDQDPILKETHRSEEEEGNANDGDESEGINELIDEELIDED